MPWGVRETDLSTVEKGNVKIIISDFVSSNAIFTTN